MIRFVLGLLLSGSMATIACTSPVTTSTSSTTSDIQNGVLTNDQPAIGELHTADHQVCTGTLIAPDVVLTAGHCALVAFEKFITTDDNGGHSHALAGFLPYPGYDQHAEHTCPSLVPDVGLVKLAAPITDIAPLDLASDLPAAGTSCDILGYGRFTDDAGTRVGTKREATSTVRAIDTATSLSVTFGTGIADHGDSGGPLVCDGKIAAAVSCHTDGVVATHTLEYYARIDGSVRTWIDANVAAWPAVATTGDASAP